MPATREWARATALSMSGPGTTRSSRQVPSFPRSRDLRLARTLYDMGDEGEAWPLVAGTGQVFGNWRDPRHG